MLTEGYLLGVGEAGRERMEILNRLYNSSTQEFLARSGLREGMRVLEVGCGIGEMTCWLAAQVGSAGRVFTVDPSPEQLRLVTARIAGIANVELQQASVYDLQAGSDRFDFAVCRWVLLHVRRPEVAVEAILSRLDHGGILALEDCVTDTAFCHPGSGAFRRFIDGWLGVSAANGLDARIGARLHRLLLDSGCMPESLGVFQPLLRTPDERRLVSMSLAETRGAHVGAGIFMDSEIDRTIADLEREAGEQRAMGFVLNYQVAGKKGSREV